MVDAAPPGSYLVLTHNGSDVDDPELAGRVARTLDVTRHSATPCYDRERDRIRAFFGTHELVEPGLVDIARWRDDGPAAPEMGSYCGVADLVTHLDHAGVPEVDVVVSSLPWSNVEPDLARRVLTAVCSVLSPTGVFATIAYRPTRINPRSRRFHRLLDSSFTEVVATATTWANLPPARLLICRHPRHGGQA